MDDQGSQSQTLQGRFVLKAAGLALGMFVGVLLLVELGRWAGLNAIAARGPDAIAGSRGMENVVFALFSLLIGFTFSGANSRYDSRRTLLGQELNAIGTAWERIILLPPERHEQIRAGFRRYLDTLIAAYTKPIGVRESLHESPEGEQARTELWAMSVAVCIDPTGEKARMMLLPSLTEVFGLVERERFARLMHPPMVIFVMLGIGALTASLFSGYSMAASPSNNWFHAVGAAAAIAIALYVIIDLEFPRLGFIRVDVYDRALVELRSHLN